MSRRTPEVRNQQIFLSELIAQRVESGPHAARFFLYLAEILDLKLYKIFYIGSPRYNRPTLVAVILYAMYNGYYESKSIEQFVGDSIGAQWILNGMKMPSYKTVGRTINCLLEELDQIFEQILTLCEEQDLIGKKRIYIDGVKVQANASKHKAMSYKYMGEKIKRGKEDLKELFTALKDVMNGLEKLTEEEIQDIVLDDADKVHKGLQKIHQKNLETRQEQIFNRNFEETIRQSQPESENTEEKRDIEEIKRELKTIKNIETEKHDEVIETLNNVAFINKRVSRMEEAKAELEDNWKAKNGNKEIPEKQQINFTDSDSCIMQTKHHGVQQCYNNFALVDDKANIILGTYTSNNSSDQLGLIPCIENTEKIMEA